MPRSAITPRKNRAGWSPRVKATARQLVDDFQHLRRRMLQVVDEEFSQAFRFSRGSKGG